jgi:hypothetical protein
MSFFQKSSDKSQLADTLNYNVNNSHPLIQNSNEYIYYKKFVSIHSEDRDIVKYPSSSEFEIEFPEDIVNVAALRLAEWTFPANYNTFSRLSSNTIMTFLINNPYNPNENDVIDIYTQHVFEYLFYNQNKEYEIVIEDGFYNPIQMSNELTNKFNKAVTDRLYVYFTEQSKNNSLTTEQQEQYSQSLIQLNENFGYTNFIIVYNNVGQKLWFGNRCDGFTLTNETQFLNNTVVDNLYCGIKAQLPDFSNWGLPSNLGLNRCNSVSVSGTTMKNIIPVNLSLYNGVLTPRFYYGDVTPGDSGFWLTPVLNLPGSEVHWIEANYKINLMGPSYFYMELEGQNCLDETSPYNFNNFTTTTNSTNGRVNSSFAKIPILTTPIAQWYDINSACYKIYYPAADRMRRFKFKIRYHNGLLVDFGVFNYSFTLEFTLKSAQILRQNNIQLYPPPTGI